jgi:hypothetical protein
MSHFIIEGLNFARGSATKTAINEIRPFSYSDRLLAIEIGTKQSWNKFRLILFSS